jgi:preprotein translocase subunit SecG
MVTLLIVIHVIVSLFLVVIVLLQHGKGADIGATFGGGGSNTLFGTEGPVPLLNKITTGAAIIFMLTSVTLAYFSSHNSTGSVMDEMKKLPVKVEKTVEKNNVSIPAPVNKQEPQAAAPAAEQKAGPEATKTH